MNTRGGWVSKVAALAAVALLAGCKAAMVIRVENHGPAVQVTANCGDANPDGYPSTSRGPSGAFTCSGMVPVTSPMWVSLPLMVLGAKRTTA